MDEGTREDHISKENHVIRNVGKFNRIEVCDAVIVIPLFKAGPLIMVENYRHGVSTDVLELPGGFINENEVCFDVARRELVEETGYTCTKVKLVLYGLAEQDKRILLV
jgi:8-oxo-dGTP pyrophosphatase MutT (NUDIX family)